MKKIRYIILIGVLFCLSHNGSAFSGEFPESYFIELLETHAEVDWAKAYITLDGEIASLDVIAQCDVSNLEPGTYQLQRNPACPFLQLMAFLNYPEALRLAERKYRAISRYEDISGQLPPLEWAFIFKAYDAAEVFAICRPDWLNGFTRLGGFVYRGDEEMVKKLLLWGIDVNEPAAHIIPMESAPRVSVSMYELIRQHGGKITDEREYVMWKSEVREGVIEEHRDMQLSLMSNRIQRADGATIPVPAFSPIWPRHYDTMLAPLEERSNLTEDEMSTRLSLERMRDQNTTYVRGPLEGGAREEILRFLQETGKASNGTLLFAYHRKEDSDFIVERLFPLFQELNLAVIFIFPEDWTMPAYSLRNDFFPKLRRFNHAE